MFMPAVSTEFCTQITLSEVRDQVAAIDLGDDCYSKIQVPIFSKHFKAKIIHLACVLDIVNSVSFTRTRSFCTIS